MPKHPLDGAVARIDRAETQIREVIAMVEDLIDRMRKDHLVVNYDVEAKKPIYNFTQPDRNALLQVLIGEVAYNLRSALDYLVFELAREDSGVVQTGTQFPIETCKSDPKDKSKGFDGKVKRFLKGLSQAHIDAIENLQPYKGVKWTETLRDISNRDKHRELVTNQAHVVTITYEAAGTMRKYLGDRGEVFVGAGATGNDLQVYTEQFIDIRFTNGPGVIETLKVLQRNVANVIDAFKPEFKV